MNHADYSRIGVKVLDNCIEVDLLDCIASDLTAVAEKVANQNEIELHGAESLERILTTLAEADCSLYLTWLRGCESLASLYGLVNHHRLVAFSRNVAGLQLLHIPVRPAVHCYSPRISEILLSEGGFSDLKQHQDWHALQSSLNTVVFWIPLTDIHSQKSRLAVWPRSHLSGLTAATKNTFGHETAAPLADSEAVAPLLSKGSCIAFSSLTIHKTFVPNDCEGLRIAIGIRHSDLGCSEHISRSFQGGVKTTVEYDYDHCFSDEQMLLLEKIFGASDG